MFLLVLGWLLYIVAVFYLDLVFYRHLIFGLTVYEDEFTFEEFRENIAVVIIMLLLWLLYTNFYNLKNKLPIISSMDKSTRIVGYIIYTISIIFIKS